MAQRVPKLCRHKASDRAYVTLDGKQVFFGRWGTPEAKARYDQAVSTWLANGRSLPKPEPAAQPAALTLSEGLVRFLDMAATYYAGGSGQELRHLRLLAKRILPFIGADLPLTALTPKRTKEFIQRMATAGGWSRPYANSMLGRLRRMAQWWVTEGLAPAEVALGVKLVPALRAGKGPWREIEAKGTVNWPTVERILPHLPPVLRVVVEVGWLTGARPSELLGARIAEIDRSMEPWIFRPLKHKNVHRGMVRQIPLGPRCRALLAPLLSPEADFVFRPQDTMEWHAEEARAHRETPLWPSHLKAKAAQKALRAAQGRTRMVGECYSTEVLGKAMKRACMAAGIDPTITPYDLRRGRAAEVQAEGDLETVRALLGHTQVNMSQHYSGLDLARAAAFMERSG